MTGAMDEVRALKAQVTQAAELVAGLCNESGLQELTTDLDTIVGEMNQGIFRLVVMGEVKKGKSSFINAMLGMGDLLPTDSDIATSTVYKIIYGPRKRVRVFFLQDIQTGYVPEPTEISEAEIPEYGTEKGNPQNVKRVDFIAVEYPADLLKSGLCIVDTPGVGGLYKAHLAVTWRYAPNADAVFFVLDSVETVLSAEEIDFLKELTSKVTQRVYFVQTKKDKAGREQWEAWEQRNRALLLEHLPALSPDRLRYFVVSSKLKQTGEQLRREKMLQESGYGELMGFLENELMALKDRALCQDAASTLQGKLKLVRTRISASLQAATADGQERLKELELQSKQKRADLAQWERTKFQDVQQEFTDRFRDLKQAVQDQLSDILDPTAPDLTAFLETLRRGTSTAQELNTAIGTYQQKWIAGCSERGKVVMATFTQELQQLLSDTIAALETHVDMNEFLARLGSLQADDWSTGVCHHQSLNLNLNGFQSARNMLGGATIGSAIAGTIAGFLTLGPAGVVLGAVGAIFGAKQAHDGLEADRRGQAMNQTERVLRETTAAVRKNALREFNRVAAESEKQMRNLFKTVVEATREQHENEVRELQQAGQRTADEQKQKAEECRQQVRRAEEVGRMLQMVITAG